MTKPTISICELRELQRTQTNTMIIDVRSAEDHADAHVEGSVNIPLNDILENKIDLDKDVTIITVCGKGGGRSEQASMHLRSQGLSSVYFLEGGTKAWFEVMDAACQP